MRDGEARGSVIAGTGAKAGAWRVGDAVEALYSNGDWYRATVVAVNIRDSGVEVRQRGKRKIGSAAVKQGGAGAGGGESGGEDGKVYEVKWEDGGECSPVYASSMCICENP